MSVEPQAAEPAVPAAPTTTPAPDWVPFGTRLHEIAEELPDAPALIFVATDGTERHLTRGELDRRSTQVARVLAGRGLGYGDRLAVSLKNSPEHIITCFAAWKVGAVPVPMRYDLPEWERGRVLDTLAPKLVVDATDTALFEDSVSASTEPLPEVTPPHGWGVCSSGSTGTPKVILMKTQGLYDRNGTNLSSVVQSFGPLAMPQRVMVPAPLYHTNGLTAPRNLMAGAEVVLLERFDALLALKVIERHRVTGFIAATPMLQRLVQLPEIDQADLSSLQWVQQGAAALPVWLGRRWCELVGPEHFYLSYGASEMLGLVVCRGDDYLEHPGSLGRGFPGTEIEILDEDGHQLGPGEVGAIYMRTPTGPGADYMGDDVPPMPRTDDGFVTVGDLGWLDDDGFLFMADRRVDMIVTGAVNVFPAEVEAALSEHPGIVDVVVIGLRDEQWGRRVHAIVQVADPSPSAKSDGDPSAKSDGDPAASSDGDPAGSSDGDPAGAPLGADEIIAFARERLAAYKVPKSVELVDKLPRTEAMKLNRAALVAERDGPEPGT